MEKSDLNELTEIMDDLAEMLGGDMSVRKYELYFAALADLTIEEIRNAANQIARTATFFPKPSDFRKAIEGNIEDKATLAWIVAQKNKNAGISIRFQDKAIHATIEGMGGWIKFCEMEDYRDESWQMKDFIKMYKVVSGRECVDYLMGQFEISNGDRKYIEHIEPPKQVDCNYIIQKDRTLIGEE